MRDLRQFDPSKLLARVDVPARRAARRWPPGSRGLAIALLVGQAGCLSHEYRVSRDELVRLAETAPDRRNNRVKVLQEIGIRRAPALDPTAQPPPPPPPGAPVYTDRGVVQDDHWHSHVFIGGVFHGGGGGRGYRGGGGPARAPGPVVAQPVGPGAQVAAPAGAAGSNFATPTATPVGTPAAPAPAPAPAPTTRTPSARSGGGSGSSEELVTYAVIAMVVASLAAVGAGLTEGMRFDGDIAVAPGQLIYLQDGRGGERPIPIAALTAADPAGAEKAALRDDEGYGIMRLERAPLNRRGFAFKVDVGSLETTVAGNKPLGFASHVQFGYFPHHRFGLLAGVQLSGAGGEDSFARHAVALEAQLFPINFWRIHLGGSAHAGSGVTTQDTAVDRNWGVPSVGGGGILEVALTTRLALTARVDWSALRIAPGNWSYARSLSAGLAIY